DTRVPYTPMEQRGTAGYLAPRQGSHKGPLPLRETRPRAFYRPKDLPMRASPYPGQAQDLPLLIISGHCKIHEPGEGIGQGYERAVEAGHDDFAAGFDHEIGNCPGHEVWSGHREPRVFVHVGVDEAGRNQGDRDTM